MQDIGVHSKLENFVVTLLVMKIFYGFLGASRACAYFRDSTAEFRLKDAFRYFDLWSKIYRLIFSAETEK